MFGLSGSVISAIFGGLSGFLGKMFAQHMEFKAAERKHQLDLLAKGTEAYAKSIEAEIKLYEAKGVLESRLAKADPLRAATRRLLAIMGFCIVAVVPAFVIFGDFNWIFLFEGTQKEGFWIFTKDQVFHKLVTEKGLPVEWLYVVSEAFIFIVTFYFGTGAAQASNPYLKK